jgi:hypothetical protein
MRRRRASMLRPKTVHQEAVLVSFRPAPAASSCDNPIATSCPLGVSRYSNREREKAPVRMG